jgi:actin-like ATPase involved in cell morphogenesis
VPYYLGIDLGTTYTSAARIRDGRAEIVTLGDRAAVIPSVLFLRDDGDVLTGDPAVRRGLTDPTRVVREFKRRVGDPTPIMVGGSPHSADALMAQLLETIVGTVSEREGSAPTGIGVTYPANWGPYKQDVLRQALRMAEVAETVILTEPEAAAIHYASTERVDAGEVVAVYDLGGGTFDAAVLRKTSDGFEILGQAEGVERLGGVDFDAAVLSHVTRFLGLTELDADDPAVMSALARLRLECVAAKEALSSDADVSIPVFLPTIQTEVRLTRAELEAMIRPTLAHTIDALRRALRGAGVTADELAAVLLVGGSSRIPLVAQLVAAELGRPIALDVHPKHTVALGAAIAAAHRWERRADAEPSPTPALSTPDHTTPATVGHSGAEEPAPVATTPIGATAGEQASSSPAREHPAGRRGGRRVVVGAAAAALALAAVGFAAVAGGTRPEATTTTLVAAPSSTTTTTVETTASAETTTTIGTREPEELQVVDTVDSLPVYDEPGGIQIGGVATLSTLRTTGRAATVDGVEWLELADRGWVESSLLQPVEPGERVTITSITLDGDTYVVEYETNYDPVIGDGDAIHIHFYFDTVPLSEAGTPGDGPWILFDGPGPFTEYRLSDRPEGATQMCATPATSGHAVHNERSFHCVDLPGDPEASAPKPLTVALASGIGSGWPL